MNGRSWLGVLISLTLALGGLPAWAQAEAPNQPAAPQGEIISHPHPIQEDSEVSRAEPIISEVLGGTLAGGLGLGLGVLMIATGPQDCDGTACNLGAGILVGLSGVLLTPLGVWGAGSLMGGEGGFLPTLGGFVLGTAAGVGLGALTLGTPLLVLAIAMPVAGAVVGYELSHASQVSAAKAKRVSSRFQVTPVLGPSRSGGLMGGLAGRF